MTSILFRRDNVVYSVVNRAGVFLLAMSCACLLFVSIHSSGRWISQSRTRKNGSKPESGAEFIRNPSANLLRLTSLEAKIIFHFANRGHRITPRLQMDNIID